MKKNITFIIMIFIIVSCATVKNFRKIVDSWIGLPASELVEVWGSPEKTKDFSEDVVGFLYVNEREVVGGGYYETVPVTARKSGNIYGDSYTENYSYSETTTIYVEQYVHPYTNHYACAVSFLIDKKTKLVQSVEFDGNDCTDYRLKAGNVAYPSFF